MTDRELLERLVPVGGENPYAAHPGFAETACPCRMTITPITRASSHGFACWYTGGHCIPGEFCGERRADYARQNGIVRAAASIEREG